MHARASSGRCDVTPLDGWTSMFTFEVPSGERVEIAGVTIMSDAARMIGSDSRSDYRLSPLEHAEQLKLQRLSSPPY